MGRIAGLVLLLLPCLVQAQDAIPVGVAGEEKLATAQADADKKVAGKPRRKSLPVPAAAAPKADIGEEAMKTGGGKAAEEAPQESVQIKGLRG